MIICDIISIGSPVTPQTNLAGTRVLRAEITECDIVKEFCLSVTTFHIWVGPKISG